MSASGLTDVAQVRGFVRLYLHVCLSVCLSVCVFVFILCVYLYDDLVAVLTSEPINLAVLISVTSAAHECKRHIFAKLQPDAKPKGPAGRWTCQRGNTWAELRAAK